MDEKGQIAGGAVWKICPTNPIEKEEHMEAYWYPEGWIKVKMSLSL